jgi:transcriptional regulator with XRE-family HTH domain
MQTALGMIKPVLEFETAICVRSRHPENNMPHPVDVEVGRRVRIRRQQLNMSQTDLANELKLTFQQVQKYEKGTNRVSCSRLFEMAKAMKCSYAALMPDEGKKADSQSPLIDGIGNDKIAFRMVEAFKAIEDVGTRRKLLGLVQAIGGMEAEE